MEPTANDVAVPRIENSDPGFTPDQLTQENRPIQPISLLTLLYNTVMLWHEQSVHDW